MNKFRKILEESYRLYGNQIDAFIGKKAKRIELLIPDPNLIICLDMVTGRPYLASLAEINRIIAFAEVKKTLLEYKEKVQEKFQEEFT